MVAISIHFLHLWMYFYLVLIRIYIYISHIVQILGTKLIDSAYYHCPINTFKKQLKFTWVCFVELAWIQNYCITTGFILQLAVRPHAQLLQVWCSYSESLLGIAADTNPSQGQVNSLLSALFNALLRSMHYSMLESIPYSGCYKEESWWKFCCRCSVNRSVQGIQLHSTWLSYCKVSGYDFSNTALRYAYSYLSNQTGYSKPYKHFYF